MDRRNRPTFVFEILFKNLHSLSVFAFVHLNFNLYGVKGCAIFLFLSLILGKIFFLQKWHDLQLVPICTSALELTGIGFVLFLLVSTDVGAIFFIYGKK